MDQSDIAEVIADLFNRMDASQKMAVPERLKQRLTLFMVSQEYRMHFTRWYLQEKPDGAKLDSPPE